MHGRIDTAFGRKVIVTKNKPITIIRDEIPNLIDGMYVRFDEDSIGRAYGIVAVAYRKQLFIDTENNSCIKH